MLKRVFAAALVGSLLLWLGVSRLLHTQETDKLAADEFLELARKQGDALSALHAKLDLHLGRLNDSTDVQGPAIDVPLVMANTHEDPVRPKAPVSLVLPCDSDDFRFLPILMESLAMQTVFPYETLLVLNVRDNHLEGIDLTELSHPHVDEKEAERMAKEIIGNATASPQIAIARVLARTQVLEKSLAQIPNVRIILRGSTHYAGSNRMYGYRKASEKTEVVTFFDCDDYMHPQRTEIIAEVFRQRPELSAAIHGYKMLKMSEWDEKFPEFAARVTPPLSADFEFPLPYDLLWERVPEVTNKTWDINDWTSEPNWKVDGVSQKTWWFPVGMKLPRIPPYRIQPHNGWLSVRKGVPDRVPYPEKLRRGQDSLYNFRLLKSKENFNYIPYLLGGYVRKS